MITYTRCTSRFMNGVRQPDYGVWRNDRAIGYIEHGRQWCLYDCDGVLLDIEPTLRALKARVVERFG